MAELSTIARPYAQGVFAAAKAAGSFDQWSANLTAAAEVAEQEQVKPLLTAPLVDRGQLAEAFIELCGERIDEQGKNLIRLLAHNRRLQLLPQLRSQYETLRAEAEGTIRATLITAQEVDEGVRDQVAQALGRRLDRKVELATETDASLLGGAVVRAGDMVIDGSARGRLERLAEAMSR